MTKFTHSLSIFSLFLVHPFAVAAEPEVFLEENGVVVMEVESAPAADGWAEKTDIDGYLGSSYYEWTGSNHFSVGSAGEGLLQYTVRISSPGNYQFRWHSYIAHGESSTESNDSWVRFPTGVNVEGEQPLSGWTKSYMNRSGQWSWDSRTVDHVGDPIRQYFEAGDHTIEVSGRSKGHAIDRIVLYQYENVNFNNNKFDNYDESDTLDGSGNNDPEPDPAPEPSEWVASEVEQDENACSQAVLSLAPTDDVFLQNNIVTDTDQLKVNDNSRAAYLKFDMSLVPLPISSVDLRLSIANDDGEGPLVVSSGDHSEWSEDQTSFDPPDNSILLGTYDGVWDTGDHYSLPIDPDLLGSDTETLILEMSAGSDDISIHSLRSDHSPRLQIRGQAGFCTQYAQRVAEAENRENESNEVPEPPEPDETEMEPTPEVTPTPDEPSTPDTEDSAMTGTLSGLSLFAGVFLALLLGATRNRHRAV